MVKFEENPDISTEEGYGTEDIDVIDTEVEGLRQHRSQPRLAKFAATGTRTATSPHVEGSLFCVWGG